MRKISLFIYPVLFFLLLISGASDSRGATLKDMSFTITRDGEAIGTHDYKFEKVDVNRQRVRIKTDIQVKIAFITIYKFLHRSSEEWYGDRFLGTVATTDDDGETKKLRVEMGDNKLTVVSNGKPSSIHYGILPASLWNPGTVASSMLMDTLDGEELKVAVENLGIDEIIVKGTVTPAKHYKISGDLERVIWYDDAGKHLLQVKFKGDDDSIIMYVLN